MAEMSNGSYINRSRTQLGRALLAMNSGLDTLYASLSEPAEDGVAKQSDGGSADSGPSSGEANPRWLEHPQGERDLSRPSNGEDFADEEDSHLDKLLVGMLVAGFCRDGCLSVLPKHGEAITEEVQKVLCSGRTKRVQANGVLYSFAVRSPSSSSS
ncbi:hypothetical protein LZ32DRAFT_661826 [Colletotrichum eremochloae]|nr:hypothetical protein LZ32DRAFT_661826 [Colletotrichum eremochloae]